MRSSVQEQARIESPTSVPTEQQATGDNGWGILTSLLLALLAGLCMAAASAPWQQAWLLPVGVATIVCVLGNHGSRGSFVIGYACGAAYVLSLTWWMRAVGTDAWLLVGVAVGIYFGLLGLGLALVRRLPLWPLWSAILWSAMEIALSAWPLGGFPWVRLAWGTADSPLALWFPWVGVTGVSFLVAFAGTSLAWLVTRARKRPVAAVSLSLLLGVLVLMPSVFTWNSNRCCPQRGAASARVAVVQGDVPGAGDDLLAVHRQVTANHVEATAKLGSRILRGEVAAPDFVLWPENSTAVDPFKDTSVNRAISHAARAVGVPIVVGAVVDAERPDRVRNQGIVWDPEGGVGERYTKRHPVPVGEYIPFRDFLGGLQIGRLAMIPRDMVPGVRSRPLEINGIRVADLICFDVAFDDSLVEPVRRGAELITVQTSNAMFINTAQPEQQFNISRLRALETGRTVVVASTNGLSGIINPDGTVRSTIAPRTTGVLVADVPLRENMTWGVRLAEPLRLAMLLLAFGALAWASFLHLGYRSSRPRREGYNARPETRGSFL